jgi:hypothetical protein
VELSDKLKRRVLTPKRPENMHIRETPDDIGEFNISQPIIPVKKKITTDHIMDTKSLFNRMNMYITTAIRMIQI